MTNNITIKNRLLISAVLLSFLLSSCSLDIDETDSLITEGGSSVFNGVENPAGSVDNLYNNISGQIASQEEMYALSEVTSDILLVPTRGTDWGDNGVWRTLHAHTWGPTHRDIVNVWNNKNGAVLRATEVIDPLSKATVEQVAHAKFVRAYNMWIIMDYYGQVPFRNPTDGPDVIPTVYNRSEAYDLIVQDLNDAIAGLPASNPTSDNKTRAVKATARFLLAKVKLNAEVYLGSYGANDLQDVIDLVDQIEADGYSLVGGSYFDLFVGPTFTNSDVIWNVTADVGTKMWSALHYNQAHPENGGGGWNGFTTLAEFYDKFEGPTNDNSIGSGQEERRGYTHTLASTNADNQGFGYGFQLGQMYGWRDGAAVPLETRTGAPLAFTKELPGLVGNNEVTGMRLLKYSPANGAFTSGTVLARFADAHLMRAEAMLRLGNTGGALAEVNELRALRENTPPLSSLDEQGLLDERGRELYQEYVRRNDMIRFGVFDDAWEFKEAGDGHTNLFPIPASALLSNPNLVQNEGY
ncbi:SusD, outer membrane protein [Fulvivirga imtechensis AK7]|uniref:SusD, outer membrane protein n=1 Tax=Fulvivirga imtechensis AK7 TaxID=1237149 RepID=L8JTE0_9BACT|nr:RagB/SusD family nutrient uptake outer membrane protein [Fulvivirga imtechensis]ELR71503.1 SusD, outer membrane protein [Fulvivirga imtechensis AK7]